jgi:hypothetical protein
VWSGNSISLFFWGCAGLIAALVIVGFPWLQFGQPLSLTGDHIAFPLKAVRQVIDGVWRINDKLGARRSLGSGPCSRRMSSP